MAEGGDLEQTIRFVVTSHPHLDHAGGLGAAAAEGTTILTHCNNEQVLERLARGSAHAHRRQLRQGHERRTNVVEGVGERDCGRGSIWVVSCITCPNEHSDGMPVAHLPAEKVLFGGHHGGESHAGAARR